MFSNSLPIALDSTHSAWLTACIQGSSADALKHIWKHTPMYTLKRQGTPNFTWWYAPMYGSGCSIQRLAQLKAPDTGRQVAGAETMTSVNSIVWNWLLTLPPWHDLMMPHGHGVENCNLWFCRQGRQLNLGESRSPTPIFQLQLLLTSYPLWVYVWVLGAEWWWWW